MRPASTGGYRALPAVDRLADALEGPPRVTVEAARLSIDRARASLREGGAVPTFDALVADARASIEARGRTMLGSVLNATGVMIHTNLGRVPLGPEQLRAIEEVASGYSNLEFELDTGTRGDRYDHCSALLTEITGAEAALVVNNNAAAVLLMLAALGKGREVIVSRGELVEIGGEFRIPDVMEWSGATLVEIGTTNRTRLADYERAIGPRTAAIFKVHPSNYRVVGFESSVTGQELARLARGRGISFFHDIGSGLLDHRTDMSWLESEPSVSAALGDGTDLVTFSGDKLLGGPQAGVIVGRRDLIDQIKHHPLLRTLRVDKLTLAALTATLGAYLGGRTQDLPLWAMVHQDEKALTSRANSIVTALRAGGSKATAQVVALESVAGGGSLPGAGLPSMGLSIEAPGRSADELKRALRRNRPPVIARVDNDRLVLDLRTILPSQDDALLQALRDVLA